MDTCGILSYGQSCRGWENSSPNGIQCPPNVLYCQPPQPIETLFIGWNPPGTAHFWNCPQDKLRKALAEVLYKLGWNRQDCFIRQFLDRHCYFVHAIPCWKQAKFPDGQYGTQLISICAKSLLRFTLARINPKRICALGRVPHGALHVLFPNDIPEPGAGFRYSHGWHRQVGPYEVVITCFPNTWPIDTNKPKGLKNRDCTIAALRRWWP